MNFVLILPSFLGRDKKIRKTLKPRRIRPISPHPRYTARKKNYKKILSQNINNYYIA